MKHTLGALAGILIATMLSTHTIAQVTTNVAVGSAKAISLANAVTADPPGIDSIHFNPAGLVKLKNRQRQFNFFYADLNISNAFGEYSDQANELFDGLNYDPSEDTVPNSEGSIDGAAIILPGTGLQDMGFLGSIAGGFSYQLPGTNIVVGTTAYTPDAAGYTRSDTDPGRYNGKKVSLTRLTYLSPSIAWYPTPNLAVGFALTLSYQGVGMELDMRAPGLTTTLLDALNEGICPKDETGQCRDESLGPFDDIGTLLIEVEENMSPTFNVGFLWEPTDWLTFGGVYRSEDKMTLEGDFVYAYSDLWLNYWGQQIGPDVENILGDGFLTTLGEVTPLAIPLGDGHDIGEVSLKQSQPAHISFGTSVRVTPKIKVNLDVKWTEYSSWESFEINFDQELDFLRIASLLSQNAERSSLSMPRDYNDTTSFALGVEYKWDDRLDLRFGYEPRPSAIPDDKQDVMLPFGDADLYGFGFGYKLSATSHLDFALAHLRAKASVTGGESGNANSTEFDNFIYNPYSGIAFATQLKLTLIEFAYRAEF